MKRFYYLSTCSTCKNILKELQLEDSIEKIDIKTNPIDEVTLDWLRTKVTSFEDLFSKRAVKYKELGLKDKKLSDQDFKSYLLSDYTFLKRPVLIFDEEITVGNSRTEIEKAKRILGK
jgi:arsenate reductase